MKQNMRNKVTLQVEGVNFGTDSSPAVTNMKFYLQQGNNTFIYTHGTTSSNPNIAIKSNTEVVVTVPLNDAKKLQVGTAECQLVFTNPSNEPIATNVMNLAVEKFLGDSYGS